MSTGDTIAQGYIGAIARHLMRGRHTLIAQDLVRRAYPPTGEMDDTPTGIAGVSVGLFNSLALVHGGLAPFKGETTLQRLQSALGPAFQIHWHPEKVAYELHRVAKTDDMIDEKTSEEIARLGNAAMELWMKTPTRSQPNEFQIAWVAKAFGVKVADLKAAVAPRESN